MTHYKFPEGTLEISRNEIHHALTHYEEVEIPGSVCQLKIMDYDPKIITQKLILDEGILYADLRCDKNIEYNIPQSLIELKGPITKKYCHLGLQAPKILCLSPKARRIHGLCGVEYLQAYSYTEIRHFELLTLKHFVLLGTNFPKKMDGDIGTGCVIHVETQQMAEHMLSQVDVNLHYVIPDAKDWKDFPADKLAMTMEEYNPESRILPKQKELREKRKEQVAKLRDLDKELEKQKNKRKMMEQMAELAIENALSQIDGTKALPHLIVNASYTGEDLSVHVRIANDLWPKSRRKNLFMSCCIEASELILKINDIILNYIKLHNFIEENRELINKYRILVEESQIPPDYKMALSLIYEYGQHLVAELNLSTIKEDAEKVTKFRDELLSLFDQGKKVFPKGFEIRKSY